MRPHGQAAQARIVRERDRQGWASATPGTLLIDEVAYGAQVHGILGQRREQGRLQRSGAVGVEQFHEPAREAPQVHVALGGELEEASSRGDGVMQAIDGAVSASGALVIEE